MTSRSLDSVTDVRLNEHTVAAVCRHDIATADAALIVQQAAETSKVSSCEAKIVEMLASRPVRKTNCTTSPQQVDNEYGDAIINTTVLLRSNDSNS